MNMNKHFNLLILIKYPALFDCVIDIHGSLLRFI